MSGSYVFEHKVLLYFISFGGSNDKVEVQTKRNFITLDIEIVFGNCIYDLYECQAIASNEHLAAAAGAKICKSS